MPHHLDHDVSFNTPPEWLDRSVVVFEAPAPKPLQRSWNVVMTREPIREGDNLRTHADRLLLELARTLAGFDLLESRELELGGQAAMYLRYTCATATGVLEQSVTLAARAGAAGGSLTIFTTTAPIEEAEAARAVFKEILSSVQFGPPRPPKIGVPRASAPTLDLAPLHVPMPGVRSDLRR
jgi:hypothetical protein